MDLEMEIDVMGCNQDDSSPENLRVSTETSNVETIENLDKPKLVSIWPKPIHNSTLRSNPEPGSSTSSTNSERPNRKKIDEQVKLIMLMANCLTNLTFKAKLKDIDKNRENLASEIQNLYTMIEAARNSLISRKQKRLNDIMCKIKPTYMDDPTIGDFTHYNLSKLKKALKSIPVILFDD